LAEAIERYHGAELHLARARQAKERIGWEWHAADRALRSAQRALSEAEATAPSARLRTLMGEPVAEGVVTVEQLERAVTEAQRALEAADKDDALIAAEISRAEDALDRARYGRQVAAGAVIAASPGVASLIDDLHAARRRIATVSEALSAIGVMAPDGTPTYWSDIRQDDNLPDIAPRDQWRAAIERLFTDPSARLPGDLEAAAA
jgi:hypothetical protein